jgi:hypothetical protein
VPTIKAPHCRSTTAHATAAARGRDQGRLADASRAEHDPHEERCPEPNDRADPTNSICGYGQSVGDLPNLVQKLSRLKDFVPPSSIVRFWSTISLGTRTSVRSANSFARRCPTMRYDGSPGLHRGLNRSVFGMLLPSWRQRRQAPGRLFHARVQLVSA